MANSIFKLVGSVFVETDKAKDDLKKTGEQAEKTGTSFGEVAGKAAAVSTAVVAAAGAAVAGIVNLASNAAETADVIDKASIRMGISAEAYQEYAYAAGLAGVETSTLEKAAKKLEGTDISFDEAIDSIMALETAEERSKKAAELFGDSIAYNLSPLVEQSAEAFYDAKKEANDLGLVLSGDTVSAGAELNDTLSKVQQSFQAIVVQLGASLMPVVQKVADWILTFMPTIQGIFQTLSPILQNLFDQLVPPLMELVNTLLPVVADLLTFIVPILGEIISEVIPIIIMLLNIFLPIFVEIVQKLLPPLLQIVKAILPIFTKILDVIAPILDVFMELLDPIAGLLEMLAPLITALITLVFEILEPFMPLIKGIAIVLSTVLGGAIEGITWLLGKAVEGIMWLVEKLIWLKDNWTKIWEVMANNIKKVFENIVNFIKTPINWIIEKINGVFSAIGTIKIPEWVPGIGGASFSLPQIPKLANGGLVDGGQLFEARESGPELVGQYGNRSAVMNNDQIVEAVSRGVAQAVAKVFNNDDLAQRIAEALQSAPLVAKIGADDVFTSVRTKNTAFIEMTGKSAFV